MNIFGGISASSLLGSTVSIDSSLLANYYTAKLNQAVLGAATSAPAAKGFMPKDEVEVPPWFRDQKTEEATLAEALSSTDFIKKFGNYFDGAGIPADIKKLYIAYQALAKLSAIAANAAKDGTISGALPGLDRQFQDGMAEVWKYLDGIAFDKLTLIEGDKLPTVKSALAVPRNLEIKYEGAVLVRGNYDDPVPGLTGNEVFTIAVKKNGGTVNVQIDLSAMTGPLTLDNIASFINSTLAANSIVSRVARNKVADGQFGLVVNGVETESLSFSAPTANPALYVAGVTGTGEDAAGQLARFDDTGGSGTSLVFARRIESVTQTGSITTTSTSGGTTTTKEVSTGVSHAVNAAATAVDSEGHIFVVGTTEGSLDGQQIQGAKDVYLTKYDSTGKVLWTRLLGAADSAEGFGLATDTKGNIVVAGRVKGELMQTAVGGGDDSFVTKYNSDGEEIFTSQIDPVANDGATSVAIDADGNIYVGGYANSAISAGVTYYGKSDATLTKLSSTGTRLYTRQLGTAENDQTRAVAIAADGDLLVASVENDHAILRKFDSSSGSGSELWSVDLGALQGGTIGAISVDGNAIYVGGTTANAALDAGGAASIVNASSGGKDGFVARIDDAGASGNAVFTSYVGTSSTDQIKGIAVANGAVYVTGDTQGQLPGQTQTGSTNGFLAKLSSAGAIDWTHQYGGRGGVASGAAIAVDAQGSSVLDVLGLPKGSIDFTQSQRLTANSTLRAGDSFSVKLNGKPVRSITIDEDETIHSLKTKLNAIFQRAGKVTSVYSKGAYHLQITVNPGNSAEFIAGKGDFDALAGLGIRPGAIVNETRSSETKDVPPKTITPDELTPLNNYVALGIDLDIGLGTKEAAKKAQTQTESALRAIRLAYQTLVEGKFIAGTGKYAESANKGGAPAYLQSQIANYQAALARLQSGPSIGAMLGL